MAIILMVMALFLTQASLEVRWQIQLNQYFEHWQQEYIEEDSQK